MRVALVIMANDVRRYLRSGFLLGVGVVVPLGLAAVFSVVFGGTDDDDGRLGLRVTVIDDDRSEASAGLLATMDVLDAEGVLSVEHLDRSDGPPAGGDDLDAEVARLVDDDARAVVVVPAGFGAALDAPSGEADEPGTSRPPVRVVVAEDRPITAEVVRSVVEQHLAAIDGARVESAAAALLGVESTGAGRPEVGLATSDRVRLSTTSFITAGTAALFLYFVALLGVTGLLEERRDGTLSRILAAPVHRASVLGAKVGLSVVLGSASVGVLLVASRFLLGARWPAAGGTALLVLAMAMAVAGITLLVSGTAKTPESASNVQSVLGIVFAMLGGWLISLPSDGALGWASRLSPNRWFLDGLQEATEQGAWTAVLPSVGVLAAVAVAVGLPGLVLVQRRLAT